MNQKEGGVMKTDIRRLLLKTCVAGVLTFLVGFTSAISWVVQAQDSKETSRIPVQTLTSTQLQDRFYKVEIENEISLDIQDLTVEQALREIARQTGLRLTYRGDIMVDKTVSLREESISVSAALDNIIEGTGLNYQFSHDGYMMINQAAEISEVSEEAALQETVRGTIVDAETGEGLVGVNIMVLGTTIGTTTDIDGNYELSVPDLEETLIFSYVGYQSTEIDIDNRNEINVSLVPDVMWLEDVVVVGYGRQERINLTGAVDHASSEDISGRVMANLTQGLQGLLPNVNINIVEGKPIHAPEINIRGATSIGQGGSALVLIDGIEGDPSMLNPNDIESISVLKDASSAAVYGARGAFGVVLITTKEAERDQVSVSYTGNYGFSQPTVPQNQYVHDGAQWANMFVESFVNWEGTFPAGSNKSLPFSQDYLDEINRRANDPSLDNTWVGPDGNYRYAHSTDWFGHLFNTTTLTHDHNLMVSGSAESVNYMVSGRLKEQEGIINLSPDDFQMLNLRASGNVQFTDWLRVNNLFEISNRTYYNPMNAMDAQYAQLDIALEGFPVAPLYNPDGTLSMSGAYALGGYAEGNNGIDFDRNVIRNTLGAEGLFFDDRVSVVGDFSYQRTTEERRRTRVPVSYSVRPGVIGEIGSATNWLRIDNDATNYLTTNTYVEFHDLYADRHDVRVMGGINYEQSEFNRVVARRDGLIFPEARDLNLALGEDIDTGGGFERWRIFGGFYRLNYIYDQRYLIELSGRYDGSSKFPEDERYAFFPSASVGWRISNEPFINMPSFITHLQLRASYGSMGNGNIGAYVFDETFSIGRTARILGDGRPRFTTQPAVQPDGLTWETATTTNVGIDFELFEGRLDLTADAYIRETTDMFTRALTPPATFGAAPPMGNYADLETRGWEASLLWRDNVEVAGNNLAYNFRISLADNRAKITRYNNPDLFLHDYYEGMVLGEIWGYETEGFFVDQADIDNHADQSRFRSTSGGTFYPGDVKLRDLTGDGQVTPGANTANDPGDRRIIGNSEPRYTFGVNLGANWNNFFLSAFFQGVGKRDWYPSNESNFWGQYNRPYNHIPRWHLNDGIIWSEDNPDSYFPRYVSRIASTGNGILRQPQTGWLESSAYVRLKSFQFGYNLPIDFITNYGMNNARIYVTGENLWSWSPLYSVADNLDIENQIARSDEMARPGETIRQGYNYPIMRTITLGLSVTF